MRAPLPRASRRGLGRLAGFASSTILGSVVSIVTIPLLINRIGADDWADLAIAQSVGTFFAVIVAFGWGVTGPSAVAVRDDPERRRYYLQSVRIRAVLLLGCTVPAAVVTLVAVHGEPVASVVTCLSLLVWSLGGGWYYVGIGAARALFLFDTAPRVAGTIVGAVLVAAGGGAVAFALAQFLIGSLSLIGPIVAVRRLPRPTTPPSPTPVRDALSTLRGQTSAVVVAATAALYVNAPLIAVGIAAPGASALYAVGDRILKFTLNVLTPIGQTFQGWVPSADRPTLVRRCRTALNGAVAVGLAGTVTVLLVILFASPLITGGQIHVGLLLALPFALAFGVIAISRIIGLVCLVALDQVRSLAISTITGAVVGVAALAVLTPIGGAEGAAVAFVVSEAAVTGAQLASLFRAFRREEPLPSPSAAVALPDPR